MIIPLPQFTAPSYGDRTLNEVQKMVNLYPEKTADGYKLISTPGLELLDSVANNAANRGAYSTSAGEIFSAHNTALYKINQLGTDTLIGSITAGFFNVQFADNGVYLVVLDNTNAYYVTLATSAITQIVDVDFPAGAASVAYQNNRFIITVNVSGGGGRFYISAIDDPSSWAALDFAAVNYSGDPVLRVVAMGSNLVFFGQRTIEPWYYTGAADFPWERITGGTLNVGIRGADALAVIGDAAYFLSSNADGTGAFFAYQGGQLRRISTPYIESLVGPLLSQSLTYCFCWNYEGHTFFQTTFTFSTDSLTVVYDATTDAWFQASSNIGGTHTYHRARCIINRSVASASISYPPMAFDSQDGKVYKVTSAYNSENGTDIKRIRTFGPIQAGASRMFHHRIRFVLEIDHDSSASYTLEPTLDWTDDGGLAYSTARTLSKAITSGTTGQKVMLEAHRLGSSRQRYYRLTFTGPAARIVLQSAELEMDVGRH